MPRKKSKRGRHRLRQEQKRSSPTASQALSRGAVNTPVTACKPSMPGFFTPKCFSGAKYSSTSHNDAARKFYSENLSDPFLHRFSHEHQERDIELLEAKFTAENYKAKFHQLLCREEEKHERKLRKKCDGTYTLTMYPHDAKSPGYWKGDEDEDENSVRYGFISADHLDGDKVAYAEQACEREGNLVIVCKGRKYSAKMIPAYPWKKWQNRVYLRMSSTEVLKLRKQWSFFRIYGVDVKFELKYSYFDRLHKAVRLLSQLTIERLLSKDASCFCALTDRPSLGLSDKYKELLTLDLSQRKAMEMIVYAEPKAPVIVVGSFGTGKTRMLAQAAYQIFIAKHEENPRVLICAHHQASADAFLTKYFGPMKEKGWRVSIARMVVRFKDIEHYDERYKRYCMTSRRVAQRLLQHKIQLVVTTCSNTLHLSDQLESPEDWFTHILIDEGAQTREPETVAPLFLCGSRTVVAIAGDHKQVGPSMLVLGKDPLKYGLGRSLLERLHSMYAAQASNNAENHSATLLSNYRCHRSLLALPSYLFYHSALIANRVAEKQALLHPRTTYSLHFICSSLDDSVVEVEESTNAKEASLLLHAAAKYIAEWPYHEWGEKDLKTVCIMASTANQVNTIRKTMRGQQFRCLWGHDRKSGVQTLKAYDIQGREFQCVFLSTAEPTTAKGKSKNPTKTPCNQYVFNTALTRAKSLIVCVGNPFLLMKIENQMNPTDEQPESQADKQHFWAEFIRRCMENKTFIIPESLQVSSKDRKEKLGSLMELIFKPDNSTKLLDTTSEKKLDSITRAYKKAFEYLPNLQRCKVQLKTAMGGIQWQMKEAVDDKTDEEPSSDIQRSDLLEGQFFCNLEVVSYRKALGHPLDVGKPVVTLNGLGSRKGAFDGDVVVVEMYESEEETDKTYGKVVGVVQKCHQERYVCQVDRHSTLHFHPIDRKTPTFVNLPRISRDLIKYRREDIEAGLTSQHQWVVVFEEDSLPLSGEVNLPRIKKIISAESADNLLFIVREIGWDPKYRLPLGAVVESLPLGTNFFHAEHLLRAAYSIIKDEFDKENKKVNEEVEMSGELPAPGVVCQAFTIDPSDARNLDDALSLVRESDGTYTMSVHIANVGGQLKKNSDDEKRAQSRGNSVYGFFRNMLPAEICQQFSLSPVRVCDVITVSAKVEEGKDGTVCVDASDFVIKVGKLQSRVKLNYEDAQYLLNQDPSKFSSSLNKKIDWYSFPGQPNLLLSLDLLYKIAMHLRVKRLGQAAYAYNVSKKDEEESWQAHLLVEELMIWANSTVAKYVFQHLPNLAVLRRQSCPSSEELRELFDRFGGVISYSVSLCTLSPSNSTDQPLLIPHSTLRKLLRAVENKDYFHLQHLLTSDYLYPQLAAASARLRAISQRAEYVCSKSIGQLMSSNTNVSPFRHHSLCLDYYTHFTSPIRRFCDVVVQRLLLSILNNTECSYSVEQLEKLCRHFNIRFREAKQFEKEKKQLELAKQFSDSCEETQVYVQRKENRFEIAFSELQYQFCLKKKKDTFHISALVCEEKEDKFLSWRAFMFSFKGNNFILENPKLCFSGANAPQIQMTVYYCNSAEHRPNDKHLKKKKADQDYSIPLLADDEDRLHIDRMSATIAQDSIAVEGSEWQNIITKVNNLKEDTMQQLSDVLLNSKSQIAEQKGHAHAHSTVKRFKASPVLKYEVNCKLGSNSIVPVWLGQTLLREPILTPCLQLMEVAPELRICLQHNTHPAECFSDPHFGQASKAVYTSLDDYIFLWKKVFLAEVAEDSVLDHGKCLTILKDVPLQWPTLKIPENSTDEFFVPTGPVTLEILPDKQNFLEYNIRINVGDLVCVRYDVKEEQCRAVYHFVVDRSKSTEKENESVVIELRHIGDSSCQVSPKMEAILREHPPSCEMQVINLQESYNRVYKLLVSLNNRNTRIDGKDRLVHLVALGNIDAIKIMKHPLRKKALRLLETDRMAHTLWTNGSELNDVQKEAIQEALTNCFQLIQGPPGTGKSETGAHIAYIFAQLLKGKQCVVYCAPSNKAVDVVHNKLCQANEKLSRSSSKKLKLLRLYGRVHERTDFPGPYLSEGYLEPAEQDGKCEKEFQPYALHHLIREDFPELTDMEETFKDMQHKNTVPNVTKLKEYKMLISQAEKEVIGKDYDIILATCNECAGHRLSHLKEKQRVAQVIVDECGMAHEPETIAAVSLSEHVVLIGDHKQLQPVIKLTAARENGLSTSLFQRYAENFEEKFPLVTLKVQYRMHTKICEFPSDLFYKGMLKPDHSIKKRSRVVALQDFWPAGLSCPIVFCDIIGKEGVREISAKKNESERFQRSGFSRGQKGGKASPHSKCNPEEANKAVEIALTLRKRLPSVEVAILTPYKAQKHQVTDEITRKSAFWITVHTINESQGDEYDYVILTTVRSQPLNEIRNPDLVQPDKSWIRENLGFVTDQHQVNVAITRAREGLIIVGNRTLLEYDSDTWRPLIEFYKENKCVVKASAFPH